MYGVDIFNPAALNASVAPPLHAGSDVKIVGGDNVTLVTHDARQQVEEHAYSLIKGGQTSVLYSPQATSTGSIVPPTLGYVPTTFGASTLTGFQTAVAQASTVYGNTYAWVNGGTTSTVTAGSHTTVYAPVRSPVTPDRLPTQPPTPGQAPPVPIPVPSTDGRVAQAAEVYGNQYSWVDGTVTTTVKAGTHAEVYAPSPVRSNAAPHHTEPTTAQSTALHGDQYSWVDGSVNATVTGDKDTTVNGSVDTTILGSQTTHVPSQATHVTTSLKTAVDTWDLTAFKTAITGLAVSINGVTASFNALKIDFTVFKLANHGINITTCAASLHSHDLTTFT